MPIYRDAQKVSPKRPGTPLSRVYRGTNLVYTSAPPVTPFSLGAVSWLPLNGDFSDHGTVPVAWNPGMGTVVFGDGYLKQLSAQTVNNGGFGFSPTTGGSIAAWVYVPADSPLNSIFSFAQVTASFSELGLSSNTTNASACTLRATFRRGSSAGVNRTFPGSFATNAWYHVVAAMSPTTPGSTTWAVRGWVNGAQLINTTQSMGTQSSITFNNGKVTADGRAWVDDVSVYNRALLQEEVLALFAAGRN